MFTHLNCKLNHIWSRRWHSGK